MSENTLLPAGIYDQLSPDAMLHRVAKEALLTTFGQFGYHYVSPPLVEFENGLLSGAASTLAKDTFRLMDPISQQMLAVRSDITTQIARIASTRFANAELPLRLSYAGDVLRVGGKALRYERQLTQAGVELIGVDNNLHADVEVIRVAVEALSNLGVKHITIDFSLPKLRGIILDELKLDDVARAQLEDAIARKDPKLIHAFGGKQTNLLLALCAPAITLEKFLALSLPRDAKSLVKQLKELNTLVKEHIPSLHVTIDPLEARDGGYHSGVAFALFARDAKGEIGRGGRYQIGAMEAVGCSLYVNILTALLPAHKQPERILLPLDTSEDVAVALRKDGYVTVQALCEVKDIKAEAVRLSCQHYWQKGVAVAV